MHYKYQANKKIYQINELVFSGEAKIKSSPLINSIIIPPDSLQNVNNENRFNQYSRLIDNASFVNYPEIALTNVLRYYEQR